MNIPNLLTLGRIVLSGGMLLALVSGRPYGASAALALFLVAAATDALDGRLARSVYGVTPIGSLLDPLADKIMICCAFVGFVERGLIPAWIAVLILSREFLVTGLRVLAGSQGRCVAARAWGKHKTFWQVAVIAAVLAGLSLRDDWLAPGWLARTQAPVWFDHAVFVLAAWAALVTIASGAAYFHSHRDLLARHWTEPGTLPGDPPP